MQEFSISPEYRKSILKELDEAMVAYVLEDQDEEAVSALDGIEAFYGNLMDDLHDSKGDPEYQQGCLERMQVLEHAFPGIINPASDEDKLAEAPWAK